ncbi:MAG: RidA family protein [Tepidiformaceae bacterium]
MTKQIVRPEGMLISPAYSHAVVKTGTPVFIAGQVALDGDGKLVGEDDAGLQAAQALENLGTVVAACGGTVDDIVKLTVFTTDLSFRRAIGQARAKFFTEGELPASTFLVVSSLAEPRFLVEIEAVAMI